MDWIDKTAQTWTYVSATQFKISGDVTEEYPHGTKVRLKQGGAYKYFYVVGLSTDASFTYVDVSAGTDFSLANASITDNYISYGEVAEGFPSEFNFNANWATTSGTAPSIGSGTLGAKFTMSGKFVDLTLGLQVAGNTGVGNGGQWKFDFPIKLNTMYPASFGNAYFYNNGLASYYGHILADNASTFRPIVLTTGSTYAQDAGITQTAPFSWGASDAMQVIVRYPIDTTVG